MLWEGMLMQTYDEDELESLLKDIRNYKNNNPSDTDARICPLCGDITVSSKKGYHKFSCMCDYDD
jgi:hypothetical protein